MKMYAMLLCAILCLLHIKAYSQGVNSGLPTQPKEKESIAYVDSLTKKAIKIYLQQPSSARAMAEKALIMSIKLKYTLGEGLSYAAIGYSYWVQSNYSLSLYYLFNARDYLKASKNYGELSLCDRVIARNCLEMRNYNLATTYLQASDTNAVLSHDSTKIGLTDIEYSLLYLSQNKYQEAWAKSKLALALSQKNRDTVVTGVMYSRQANILNSTGQHDLAKKYFDTAFIWCGAGKNKRLKAYLFNNYSEYYIFKRNFDTALLMSEAAYRLADSIGNMEVKLRSKILTMEIYKETKNATKELECSRSYIALEDSVRKIYKASSFELLEQFFALNTKLRDLEKQEQKEIVRKDHSRFQHVIILVLIVFIAFLLAGLITIFYLYKEKGSLAQQLSNRNYAITEQKNIIEQQSQHLSELNDLKTKLFAVIGHDLRTPISSLRSIMGMFQQRDLTEDQAVALLKRMLPALDGADLTLSNLLNWSVKQMNGLKVNKSTIAILPMAEEIKGVFEFALQQKNITLSINIPDKTMAFVDEQHLKIILRNLVSNAIKFTPQNGNITIGEHSGGGKTTICVRDTGQGMSADNIAKLFVTTINFSTRGTAGEKGTGLGLVLCKELLDLNNGRIYVESAVGSGSAFYIEIQEK